MSEYTYGVLSDTVAFVKLPQAAAQIRGSDKYPDISGTVKLYQTDCGVVVAVEIQGLPLSQNGQEHPVFGFHIHSGESCTGDKSDPFADALTHFNPEDLPHPYHAGDLPPLFSNCGYSFSVFLTNRFKVDDVINKVIIIHASPDDFTTQPAGNSGTKIACGVIMGR